MSADAQQELLDAARRGDREALGRLLHQFRPYVRVLTRSAWNHCLQARLDDSDLIQDALMAAQTAFLAFRGSTVAEFAGWLRTLALRAVGHAVRAHVAAEARSVDREQASVELDRAVAASAGEPESVARRHERAARVAAALERLPGDMAEVLRGRVFDGLSYAELAARMRRGEGALRVLYTRALRRLGDELQGGDSA